MKAQKTVMAQAIKMTTCAMLGAFLGNAALTYADNNASTSTVLGNGVVIPYDGYLMLDSAPVNTTGQVLQFDLYDSPSGGVLQWSETQSVDINGGRFSVALGKGTKIASSPGNATFEQVVLDAEKLYLNVLVQDNTGAFIELSGRQAIEATPFAAWSAHAADFNVAGQLDVQGDASLSNNLDVSGTTTTTGVITPHITAPSNTLNVNASSITLGGNTNVQGRLDAPRLSVPNGTIQRGGTPITSTSDLGLYSDVQDNWLRFVTNNGNFAVFSDGGAGTDPIFQIGPAGDVITSDNIVANSNRHDNCGWTDWKHKVNTADGQPPASAVNNVNSLFCPQGRYAVGMDFSHPLNLNGSHEESYRIWCCEL